MDKKKESYFISGSNEETVLRLHWCQPISPCYAKEPMGFNFLLH